MISIGAVVLSDHLLLPGFKNLAARASSTRPTIGGRVVDQSVALSGGQELELVDPGEFGLFTGDQLDAINGYKISREVVEFVHHLGTWNVVVHEVNVEQSDGLADPTGDHTWTGSVVMLVME